MNRSITLLLVEDDPVAVMTVERALRRAHLEVPVLVARDGQAALAMLRNTNGNGGGQAHRSRTLVLLDLNMPRMNGLEFLREIRSDNDLRHLPVVVLTTSDDPKDRRQSYEFGAAGYFVKPLDFADSIALLTRVVAYWSAAELPD